MCESCNDKKEILFPQEQILTCKCGGNTKRIYSTPLIHVGFKKDYVTQSIGKDGKKGRFTSENQMMEWGKRNGVTFEKD